MVAIFLGLNVLWGYIPWVIDVSSLQWTILKLNMMWNKIP